MTLAIVTQCAFTFLTSELTWNGTPIRYVLGFVLQAISLILLILDFCGDGYRGSKIAVVTFNMRLALNLTLKIDETKLARSYANTAGVSLLIIGNSLLLSLSAIRFRNLQFVV